MSLLYPGAAVLIQANLDALHQKNRVRMVVVGQFTPSQFAAINALKRKQGLPPVKSPEIVFLGSHLYKSRVTKDGYSVDDVMLQIESAPMATSVVLSRNMTTLQSAVLRQDGYGNQVRDEAVFECTLRKPRAELYSVIPKGDHKKPPTK